ncbi:Probable sensor-like histidine kinase YehU [Serratia fonticola]|uniref:Probable sensor-like histidine kinase YehU n=1 Tax=Serratia fonticola TaxID=47917 RepID=A0A4V6KMR1_SERFO|nr:Probable sensor-like histidine kinase YehU [Serratia fonticola]
MAIILIVARPFPEAVLLVEHIVLPMLIANTVGAAMFMQILLDRRAMFEKYTSAFSSKALKIGPNVPRVFCARGLTRKNSMKVARVVYQELGIGAVAITDRDKLLAFIGIGDDHHLPGTPISSVHSPSRHR